MDAPTCANVEYNSGLEVQAFPSTWHYAFAQPFPNPIRNSAAVPSSDPGLASSGKIGVALQTRFQRSRNALGELGIQPGTAEL